MKSLFALLGALFISLLPTMAFAEDKLSSGDTAWMLTATVLVLFMTIPGLSMFYAGMVPALRSKMVIYTCKLTFFALI